MLHSLGSSRLSALIARALAAVGSAGLWPRRLVTLEVRDRSSDRLVSRPVTVAVHDGDRYLVAIDENANWVANVRAAEGRAILRHGRRERVRLEEVARSARAPILRRYLEVAPVARAHIPVDRLAPLAEFERVAPHYPVFRVCTDQGSRDRSRFALSFPNG